MVIIVQLGKCTKKKSLNIILDMMNYRLCKNALIVIFKRCQQNGAVNQIRRKCIQDILYIFDEGLKVRMCKELITQ